MNLLDVTSGNVPNTLYNGMVHLKPIRIINIVANRPVLAVKQFNIRPRPHNSVY